MALTFDDGPGRSTGAILTIVKRYRVPATFFNIGAAMATRPYLVRDEVRAGFAMGNHSWDHPHMTTLPAVRQAAELSQASAEQRSIAGTAPCVAAPGRRYAATTLRLAQQQRMSVWLWSVDTVDWAANGSGSSYWVQRIIRLAEQGDTLAHPILLMHDARPGAWRLSRPCPRSSSTTAVTTTASSRSDSVQVAPYPGPARLNPVDSEVHLCTLVLCI